MKKGKQEGREKGRKEAKKKEGKKGGRNLTTRRTSIKNFFWNGKNGFRMRGRKGRRKEGKK